jgi:hypothetical protein
VLFAESWKSEAIVCSVLLISWALGKWPACVAFILAMQAAALAIALAGWRTPRPTQANL